MVLVASVLGGSPLQAEDARSQAVNEGDPKSSRYEHGALRYLDQGWSDQLRSNFYWTPQGSRMMPLKWFLALETPQGLPFSDPRVLARYGLLPPDRASALNPHNLPVGFAIDPVDALGGLGQHVGLTCAACHTADIRVGAQTVRVDGAPANFDFDSFYRDLARLVRATAWNGQAFKKFAAKVLADVPASAQAAQAAQLRQAFLRFETNMTADAVIRQPAVESGFGRVDALTQIINAMAINGQGTHENLFPVGAPVSYPFLWLTPQMDAVQWSPIASNAIARNGGQVLGVFASLDLRPGTRTPLASSMLIDELHGLETWVSSLKPPVWDEDLFGKIDQERAARGGQIYQANCAGCHDAPPYRRTKPQDNITGNLTFIQTRAVPIEVVGADSEYLRALGLRNVATNAVVRNIKELKDVPLVAATTYTPLVVRDAVLTAMAKLGYEPERMVEFSGYRFGKDGKPFPAKACRSKIGGCMKAGPLTGIWATGPFLHNGSVATVYELLSPLRERRTVFWTGGQTLDTERLGFISENSVGRFKFDTSIPGNQNIGHEFPKTPLTHEQRMDVIEYLKTLGSLPGAAGTAGD